MIRSALSVLKTGVAALAAALVLSACDPIADIVSPTEITTAAPASFSARLMPQFSGTEVLSYQWDFGDGQTATGASVQHQYAKPGRYVVTLSAQDASSQQFGQAYVSKSTILVKPPGTQPDTWANRQSLGACQASGQGTDYQVGPGANQLAALDLVPWEALKAGDTVRIYHRPEPYRGKMLIAAQGTATAPVRVCGVKGPNGERPVIDGNGATTRPQLANLYGHPLHQSRSVVVIKTLSNQAWQAYPQYVILDGLEIRSAHPNYTFTDAAGAAQSYVDFGACLWVDRGHHIVIADNHITDCTNGIYTKSTDDGLFAVTTDILIRGNHIHGNGIVGGYHMHETYTASHGIVYEFNRIGPPRPGATGNAIKDRSAGTVVRFNQILEGARAIDLVEAEDFSTIATTLPEYRTTLVYGNQILKNGDTGSVIHYGGDHLGAEPTDGWGEPIFRKGTLYFYNNTVKLTGVEYAVMCQISTTEERAEIFNNVILFDPANPYPRMRSGSDTGASWTSGGIVNLGVNWISQGWMDSDPWHPVGGSLLGTNLVRTGALWPLDASTLAPTTGGALIDQAQALPAVLAAHPVNWQLDAQGLPQWRATQGPAADIGALEHP